MLNIRAGKEARDMGKFFTIKLELAQTSFMLFVESTYFFFAFCGAQEEIPEFLQPIIHYEVFLIDSKEFLCIL